MGVYLPKGNESNDKDKTPIFYARPTVGLGFWGPLVPAPDNKTAILILSGVQFGLGLLMFKFARINWNTKNRYWTVRFRKYFGLASSIYFTGFSVLELLSHYNYNPYAEECRKARILAEAKGEQVSWWFGPKDYKPMDRKQFVNKLDQFIEKAETAKQLTISEIVLAVAFQNSLKAEIQKIQLNNKIDTLADKPELQLASTDLDTDEDLQFAWDNLFNPWEELWHEVDYSFRFIPRWKMVREAIESTTAQEE
ncbi:hypothetical protein PACTADRAFT_1826 [Pachysolen tannophilus NRRL Y-2460]|uniref:Mitochondrial inner membrane i-AAA protease complex subunit MGR1 n=1 Tax=Pachysolen tannophilus NRRL Y-2460 TaxID=669874 RepID=A0A1E4TZS5_PACTA|nr:hypothetical protein PACTADRAFT_1826 [Pachysolen tannophilus NRRL Y-2460]